MSEMLETFIRNKTSMGLSQPRNTTSISSISERSGGVSRALDRLIRIHNNALNSISSANTVNNYVAEEKLFFLPSDKYEVIDFSEMNNVVVEDDNPKYRFLKGEKYALRNVFNKITKLYELVGVVDTFNDVNVNYVIMKQIGGDDSNAYSLTRHDCEQLGIEYQDGLLPFPKNMNWERIIDNVEFDKNDLSTTPRSYIDNTIRYMLLVLNGFEDYSDGYILSPSGKLVKENDFLTSLRVINEEPITYHNFFTLEDKTKLNAKIIKPNELIFNHGNFISSDNKIYILIDFRQFCSIKDGFFGIKPDFIKGLSPSDLFSIAWNEFGCLTVDEYEKLKEEKKRAEEDRINKLEAQRKQYEAERARRMATYKDGLKATIKSAPNIDFDSLRNIRTINKGTMDMYVISASKIFDTVQRVFSDVDEQMTNVYENIDSLKKNLEQGKFWTF